MPDLRSDPDLDAAEGEPGAGLPSQEQRAGQYAVTHAGFRDRAKKAVMGFFLSLPLIKQAAARKFAAGMKKMEQELSEDL